MRRVFRIGCGGCLLFVVGFVVFLVGLFVYVYILAQQHGSYVEVDEDILRSALLSNPPAGLKEPVTLTVVTFNIQALWVVGFNRPTRMRALGVCLTELDPDIVGFQEAFVDEDRQLLIDSLSESRLKHFEYYESRMVGSGLLIASAYPIKEIFYHRYSVSNEWYKLWEGDWWAGKGVALARIELPNEAGYVDFYDTHAQAGYGNLRYNVIRKQQMMELAEFVNRTHVPDAVGFLVGDMNCPQGREDYQAAVDGANLVRIMNVTSRIDHIFAVKDAGLRFDVEYSLELDKYEGVRLSDHNGYLTRVVISPVS